MEETEEAKRRLAELATAPGESWDDQIAVLKAVKALVDTNDVEAQRFVVEQVRRAGNTRRAGWMALALLGEAEGGPADLKKKLALSPAQPEAIRGLEAFLPTGSGTLLDAAVRAVLRANPERALEIFRPFLEVGPNPNADVVRPAFAITTWALIERPVRPLIELAVRTALRLGDRRFTDRLLFLSRNTAPEWEAELAHLLEVDLPPQQLYVLLRAAATDEGIKIDPRRRKRLLPLLREVADRVRSDPAARSRLEEAEKALELPGALLSMKPVKVPKAPPQTILKHGAATEGGPVLALPVEVVSSWSGTLLPNGKRGEGDFSGTDYGRACDVSTWHSPWGPYGFVAVGSLRGLVLGQAVQLAKEKDGSCLLVMEGNGEEVAAVLKEDTPWKKIDGAFDLPSGQLVLFDSAFERAKTHKTTVKLAPGKYAIDEYEHDDGDLHLWVVRLKPAAG